jgi:16S rRNA (adenine1518-N6/adenine1519-N6)-dimethyltransferase
MNIIPKKRYGQHFLTAPYYAERIAAAVPATADETVVEIGAGAGALSAPLIKRFAGLQVIEKDRELVEQLRQRLGPGRWRLHNADAVSFDFAAIGERFHAVGNLPYNAGAHIIRNVLGAAPRVVSATFMVQREVAERIVATPGGRRMGFLSVFCQFFGAPAILFHVPPGAFFPKPKVESSVFQVASVRDPEAGLARDHWARFFSFVDRCFQQRRKMLVNTVDASKERARELLHKAAIDPSTRPESLSVDQWVRLYAVHCGAL